MKNRSYCRVRVVGVSIAWVWVLALESAVLTLDGAKVTRAAEEATPLTRWSFEKDTQGWLAAHDCQVEVSSGVLRMHVTGPDPFCHGPAIDCQGPLVFRFRARSTGGGQGRVYWTLKLPSDASTTWGEDAVVYFDMIHDGQWHDYAVVVNVSGRIGQLRFDPGKQSGVVDVAWIELSALASGAGQMPGANPAMPAELSMQGGALSARLDTRTHRFTVTDERTQRRWVSSSPVGVSRHGTRICWTMRKA
jgi:hypothetical protein